MQTHEMIDVIQIEIQSLREEGRLANIPDAVNGFLLEMMLRDWQQMKASPATEKHGFLEVGIDPNLHEVVINLDRDRTGHVTFSPQQARYLADVLKKKATEAEETDPLHAPPYKKRVPFLNVLCDGRRVKL
jgi:hypothetical protein